MDRIRGRVGDGGERGTKMRQVAVLCEGVPERNQNSCATPASLSRGRDQNCFVSKVGPHLTIWSPDPSLGALLESSREVIFHLPLLVLQVTYKCNAHTLRYHNHLLWRSQDWCALCDSSPYHSHSEQLLKDLTP